ncbi:MAG TPA: TIGR04086 family membrane protein [Candidatus Limnocylindrales bacterium]|nr:TIGR04086 family membrane protein [Candidatus Limnocylindrales bacterium]
MSESWEWVKSRRTALQERPRLAITLIISVVVFAILAFCRFGHPHLQPLVSKQTDSRLALILYLVGGLFVLMGGIVSVKPPKKTGWKIISFMVFLFLFYAGFLVTNEQGARLAKVAQDAQNTRNEDKQAKDKYDGDVRELQSNILAIYIAIATIAKNSPDSTKWNALLSEIDKVKTPASTTVVIPPVSSGNLKERTLSLANELNGFVAYRRNVLEDRYAREVKPGENRWPVYKSWDESTSGWYRQRYEQQVLSIVPELAAIHLRDQRLDGDLETIKSIEQIEQLTGNRTSVNLFTIQEISERMTFLANSIH